MFHYQWVYARVDRLWWIEPTTLYIAPHKQSGPVSHQSVCTQRSFTPYLHGEEIKWKRYVCFIHKGKYILAILSTAVHNTKCDVLCFQGKKTNTAMHNYRFTDLLMHILHKNGKCWLKLWENPVKTHIQYIHTYILYSHTLTFVQPSLWGLSIYLYCFYTKLTIWSVHHLHPLIETFFLLLHLTFLVIQHLKKIFPLWGRVKYVRFYYLCGSIWSPQCSKACILQATTKKKIKYLLFSIQQCIITDSCNIAF